VTDGETLGATPAESAISCPPEICRDECRRSQPAGSVSALPAIARGKSDDGKNVCLVTSLLALLLSVKPYGAVTPWLIGMIIAAVAVFERFRRCRLI
jgi:hypothetical protein